MRSGLLDPHLDRRHPRAPCGSRGGRGIIADFDLNAGMIPGQDIGRPFNQKFGKNASVRTWYLTDV
jgi:hypothetical protein